MKIPKRFLRQNMSGEEKKRLEAWIQSKRDALKQEPTFKTAKEAIEAAVKMSKNNADSLPSVWEEPEDVGNKFAVVHFENREKAYISGYTEKVGIQEIFDIANGIRRDGYDEIEEV